MFKVFGLMTGLTLLLVFAGQMLFGQQGAVLFLVLSGAMNFGMYWFSDRVVLRMYRAQVVDRSQAPDLYDRVERLRKRAGLPAPVVAVSPQPQPNAFATGRSPEHAVVCFTQGILRALPPRELDGVIAHELAHIKHRHMLVGTVAATMAGAIAMIASIARWGFIFGGGRDDGDNPLGMLVMAIVAPLAAVIIQMAISRRNEFQADRTGGEITGDPMGLAGALKRLESGARRIPMEVNPAGASLAIVNPFAGRRRGLTSLFTTHPPTEERVAALRAQAAANRAAQADP